MTVWVAPVGAGPSVTAVGVPTAPDEMTMLEPATMVMVWTSPDDDVTLMMAPAKTLMVVVCDEIVTLSTSVPSDVVTLTTEPAKMEMVSPSEEPDEITVMRTPAKTVTV